MQINLLLIIFVLIIPMIPTFWAIIEIPRRQFSSLAQKAIWFAVVSLLPVVGAVLYFAFARRHTRPA